MKISAQFKKNLYATLFFLYSSGLAVWILGTFCKVDNGFGAEPPKLRLDLLHIHSIVGLWFFLIFGYLFRVHIEISWRFRKKRISGAFLTAAFAILFLTVPGLFYLVNEKLKQYTILIHTYLGLLLILPFFLHYYTKKK